MLARFASDRSVVDSDEQIIVRRESLGWNDCALTGGAPIDSRSRIPNEVVPKCEILRRTPWRCSILIDRLEQQSVTDLSIAPIILDHVSFDQDATCVLRLDQILHCPYALPRWRTRDMIASDGDIARNEIRNGWITAAEHDDFVRCFHVIVFDQIRSGTVETEETL